jgi:hypothetical protein
MPPGYIYIFTNPAMSGYVKIGRTERTPAERANELSSHSGVPGRFEVAHKEYVPDCISVESEIHQNLSRFRYSKEFFQLSIDEAIEEVSNVSDKYRSQYFFLQQNTIKELQDSLDKKSLQIHKLQKKIIRIRKELLLKYISRVTNLFIPKLHSISKHIYGWYSNLLKDRILQLLVGMGVFFLIASLSWLIWPVFLITLLASLLILLIVIGLSSLNEGNFESEEEQKTINEEILIDDNKT